MLWSFEEIKNINRSNLVKNVVKWTKYFLQKFVNIRRGNYRIHLYMAKLVNFSGKNCHFWQRPFGPWKYRCWLRFVPSFWEFYYSLEYVRQMPPVNIFLVSRLTCTSIFSYHPLGPFSIIEVLLLLCIAVHRVRRRVFLLEKYHLPRRVTLALLFHFIVFLLVHQSRVADRFLKWIHILFMSFLSILDINSTGCALLSRRRPRCVCFQLRGSQKAYASSTCFVFVVF